MTTPLRCLSVLPMLIALLAGAALQRTGEVDAADLELETVAELEMAPGNITVTPDGQVIFSLHQHFEPQLRVAALGADGEIEPFPNEHWNAGDEPGGLALDSVLGIQSDTRGIVWMLDNGMRNDITPKFEDDALLLWPDAFSYGPDGKMYVVANQLHLGPVLNAGEDETSPPYYIFRFEPLAPGTIGR